MKTNESLLILFIVVLVVFLGITGQELYRVKAEIKAYQTTQANRVKDAQDALRLIKDGEARIDLILKDEISKGIICAK